jgi:poly-gamma-glutamate capsule biosynthesis protein CapA/YwtB (metallophosphatase superfamily)
VAALALAGSFVLPPGGSGATAPAFVRIAAVGDIALARVDEPDALFRRVQDGLHGDVVLGNLEGTLASGGRSKCGPKSTDCFAFRAPPAYARVLRRAGFTLLNLANNHALDFGPQGQAETVAALDRAGVRHTGRPGEIAYQRVGGLTVAVLGFAPYPWAQSLLDLAAAQRLVRHSVEAADLVIVTMHAGAEGKGHEHVRPGPETFLGEQRGDPQAFAHAVIDAGADLVVGHGPHVLRGLEWYRGRLIAYSLGNLAGPGTLNVGGSSGVGAILQVTLRADGSWGGGALLSVRLLPPGVPAPDPSAAADRAAGELSRADFGAQAIRVSPVGLLTPPR